MLKRVLDVSVASIVLLLGAPLFGVIALLVRYDLGPSILFRQDRPGLHGRPFRIVKFRTMRELRNRSGNLLPDQARLTLIGRLLRRTSLDELPEFWNVLIGEMSLVGPRPLLMEYLPLYTPEQARRHQVRPGITGWAQIHGRNAISWEERLALDVWYVDHRSSVLDFRILGLTLLRVLEGDGISQPGEATMQRFTGSHAHD